MFNIGVIVQQNFIIYGKYLFVSVLLTGKLVEIVVLRKDNVKNPFLSGIYHIESMFTRDNYLPPETNYD